MKKISLIILCSLISTISTVTAVTVGGLGVFTPGSFSTTGRNGNVEFELSVSELSSNALSLSADNTLISRDIVPDLSLNIKSCAGIIISKNRFGFNVYLREKLFLSLYPKSDYDFFEIGLGARVGL